MARTGSRISEAWALSWSQVDLAAHIALLLKTKRSTNSMIYLTDELADRLRDLRCAARARERVLKLPPQHQRQFRAVGERVGIPNKPRTRGRQNVCYASYRAWHECAHCHGGFWLAQLV
jgi:integrase